MARPPIATERIAFFEEPIPPGWVYPCSTVDLRRCLTRLPPRDLAGLEAVGLAAATRKDCSANGRYFSWPRPTIRIYSWPESLAFKMPPHTRQGQVEPWLAVELEFGMRIERIGGRYHCRWHADNLRRFILEHVLLHEVGHHVSARERMLSGHGRRLRTHVSEQLAEHYAHRRRAEWRPRR